MLELFTDKMLHDVDDDTGEDYGVACNGFFGKSPIRYLYIF